MAPTLSVKSSISSIEMVSEDILVFVCVFVCLSLFCLSLSFFLSPPPSQSHEFFLVCVPVGVRARLFVFVLVCVDTRLKNQFIHHLYFVCVLITHVLFVFSSFRSSRAWWKPLVGDRIVSARDHQRLRWF